MKAFQEAAKSRMPCATCGTMSVDGYPNSPNAYQGVGHRSSLDSLTAVSVAPAVPSVSTFSSMPEVVTFLYVDIFGFDCHRPWSDCIEFTKYVSAYFAHSNQFR